MPHLPRRAVRVGFWTAFCAVAAMFLWHQAQVPLNAEATRLELSPKSGRFGPGNLWVMFRVPAAGGGSPGSGALMIDHGGGNWIVSLPDLRLVDPDMGKPQPLPVRTAHSNSPPLTEAGLARLLTPSEWPSRDAEFTADMDELWSLVRSSPSGGLSTRLRRFSILHADPWRRPL